MGDPFDELLAILHPDRWLGDPRATGAGVRVAVVDSGIDRDALASRHPEAAAIHGAIFSPEPKPYEGRASSPHGTTVADVILTVAPRVELYSADVFGPLGASEPDTIVAAIYHALDEWRCRVINLSLGVVESRLQPIARRLQLQRAIDEAYGRGVVVVAAAHNDHPISKSYPAAFAPPVLSVDKALFENPLEVRYEPREQVEFLAHGRGYLGPFAREPATSWAAPHVSGVAAKLISLRPELRPFEIKALIAWMMRARSVGHG